MMKANAKITERRGIGQALRLRRVLALNLGVLLLVGWGFTGEFLRGRSMEEEIGRLDGQASELEDRNVELRRTADRLSGSAMLEREARLKLNMRRPGESVVVVKSEGPNVQGYLSSGIPAADSGSAGGSFAAFQVSNYHKWIRHFFPHDQPYD